MATVSIDAVAQLTVAEGSGAQGDISVDYSFSAADGNYNVNIEFKSNSNNWVTAWDTTGTIGVDVVSTSLTLKAYFEPGQYGDGSVETVSVPIRITAFKG